MNNCKKQIECDVRECPITVYYQLQVLENHWNKKNGANYENIRKT